MFYVKFIKDPKTLEFDAGAREVLKLLYWVGQKYAHISLTNVVNLTFDGVFFYPYLWLGGGTESVHTNVICENNKNGNKITNYFDFFSIVIVV